MQCWGSQRWWLDESVGGCIKAVCNVGAVNVGGWMTTKAVWNVGAVNVGGCMTT